MPEPDFRTLSRSLLAAGVGPTRVQRMVEELTDHYDDLVCAAMAAGERREEAEIAALRSLGDLRDVSLEIQRRPELKSWAWHWPRLAATVYPLAYLTVLPFVPLVLGARYAHEVARWAACLFAGAFVTALMFLALQLAITLG